ncbi:MAG: M20 family metallopeptidase, partial [Blastocatellia bacterium]|nr:M20 family metallopeptidase [Blastocatellia bacterium]
MNAREVLDYYKKRETTVIKSIREIVEIESPSHDAEASRKVADWVETAARATGAELSIERISVADGDHLVIRAFGGRNKPILLLGHTDTVHPVGTREQNPTRIEDGKLFGCGIFDMKSGVVLMLEALRFFAATGTRPPRPITILLSCDEEVGSHSGRELVEREARNADVCLVFEPSANGRVKTGRKGTGFYTLHAHGVPSHAGLEPEKGANAIAEIARQIPHIHVLENAEIGTTVNVCTMHGGTTTNVIPEHAQCTIDVRFSSLSEAQRIDTAVRKLQPQDSRVSLEIVGDINRPPMERTDAIVRLFENARDIAAEFDYELDERQVGGASDG